MLTDTQAQRHQETPVMRILPNMNTHSDDREHLDYPRIGLVLFLT